MESKTYQPFSCVDESQLLLPLNGEDGENMKETSSYSDGGKGGGGGRGEGGRDLNAGEKLVSLISLLSEREDSGSLERPPYIITPCQQVRIYAYFLDNMIFTISLTVRCNN